MSTTNIIVPPHPQLTIQVLEARGHVVSVRENRNGGLRYRIDGGKELAACQMTTFADREAA